METKLLLNLSRVRMPLLDGAEGRLVYPILIGHRLRLEDWEKITTTTAKTPSFIKMVFLGVSTPWRVIPFPSLSL
ncbi:MAG: hypothetical protein HOK62_00480 [Verrucomicrobiales bacterium]|nr:hypothetical protein [Verrucomicrobiales bacterium]